MTLSRNSGSELQHVEDWIGCGALRFAPDPILDPGEAFSRLMDVVAVDVGNGVEQLLDAFIPASRWRYRRMGAASRYQRDRARSIVLCHPIAFPLGIPAVAETTSPAPTQTHPLAG
ncbi:MAG TPA: hypothetical protein VLX67_08445 [Stellaceae bacterium]|nr:hypothetical protein [Stellaceae bacterium]